jgi:hypothetical protein
MGPATDRQCPECGDRISVDARACACGWRKNGAKRTPDGPDLTCPWNDHGHICGQRGSMSDGMNGAGPWYCSEHYWRLKGRSVTVSDSPKMSYRDCWYLAEGMPYESPKSGNAGDLAPKRRTA